MMDISPTMRERQGKARQWMVENTPQEDIEIGAAVSLRIQFSTYRLPIEGATLVRSFYPIEKKVAMEILLGTN